MWWSTISLLHFALATNSLISARRDNPLKSRQQIRSAALIVSAAISGSLANDTMLSYPGRKAMSSGTLSGVTTVAFFPSLSSMSFRARFEPAAAPSGDLWQVTTTFPLFSRASLNCVSSVGSIICSNILLFSKY